MISDYKWRDDLCANEWKCGCLQYQDGFERCAFHENDHSYPTDPDTLVKAPLAITRSFESPQVVVDEKVARKRRPVFSGVLAYFPDALMEVAYTSWVGNEQHNPGEPLHWAKEKSTDEADALIRHLMEAGKIDTDGVRHSAKVAWRALALLQRELDAEKRS